MLNVLLKKAGVVVGPSLRHISHSSMECIKKDLLGMPQMQWDETFLRLGAALHEAFLLDDFNTTFKLLNEEEKQKVRLMIKRLQSHPVVISLMRDAIKEKPFNVKIEGNKVKVILDAKQPRLRRGYDLKSTSCLTQADFEKKMRELGYIRQGLTYKLAAKLQHFYFVGICKFAPFNIFILDIDGRQFKEDYVYAKHELKFLLYFYKHYGKTKTNRDGKVNGKPTNGANKINV